MNVDIHQYLTTMVAEQRRLGRTPRFGCLAEADFRLHHAREHLRTTRPLLLVLIGLLLAALVGGALAGRLVWPMAIYAGGVLIPALACTCLVSLREPRHELYQNLLAATMFAIGLVVSSLALRGSLHGHAYYFGAVIAWVFSVWLVVGLLFPRAAITALSVSAIHAWGVFHWQLAVAEVLFTLAALSAANLVGACCCHALESAARRAWLESRTLGELAERDGLTGLHNRRRYEDHIDKVWRQSRRDDRTFMLVLLDIDHFKAYNDHYGHQAGDDALRQVAAVLARFAQRPLDLAARLGGEEFALILYGGPAEQGRSVPEELRRAVEALGIPHAASPTAPVLTISVGVAVVSPGAGRSLAGAIQLADEALYQAKEEGRNLVVVNESLRCELQTGRFRATRR